MYICLLKKDDCMSHCKYPFLGVIHENIDWNEEIKEFWVWFYLPLDMYI